MNEPEFCLASERVDGPKHSWRFDGDDPYTICVYCGERRDAFTGRVIDHHGWPSSALTEDMDIPEATP
jgi:hypothetical protein